MTLRETDIVYETRKACVMRDGAHYTVYIVGVTHSVSDCSFPRSYTGLGLAICRADFHAHKLVPYLPLLPTATAVALATLLHK